MARDFVTSSLLASLPGIVPAVARAELTNLALARLQSSEKPQIHSADDGTSQDIGEIYEPLGRGECLAGSDLDSRFDQITSEYLDSAEFEWLPEEYKLTPWYLFEYGPGQYIIPHADGSDAATPGWKQLAAVSLWFTVPAKGGEFFTVLNPFPLDWTHGKRVGLDPLSSSYDYSKGSRWVLKGIAPGDGMVFGSEVVHGTLGVEEGSALKALCFITVPDELST